MVGYGPEDDHFVVELTYNYGIGSYKIGTDFRVSGYWMSLNPFLLSLNLNLMELIS